jgi:hypothetical protein
MVIDNERQQLGTVWNKIRQNTSDSRQRLAHTSSEDFAAATGTGVVGLLGRAALSRENTASPNMCLASRKPVNSAWFKMSGGEKSSNTGSIARTHDTVIKTFTYTKMRTLWWQTNKSPRSDAPVRSAVDWHPCTRQWSCLPPNQEYQENCG